jgi:F-type H+-transporting ATPase subunit b
MGRILTLLVIGLGLMVGGVWFSHNVHLGILDKVAEMGIPLDLGMTIATIGVFLALFPVIDTFYVKPLKEAIDTRNSELESTFTEAENLKSEMSKMRSDYEKRLADTEANAREQIQSSIKEAQNLRQTLLAEATEKADLMVKKANEEIEASRAKALADIRSQVVDLSLLAAEKVVGENMNNDRNRKLVDDFISTAEVSR